MKFLKFSFILFFVANMSLAQEFTLPPLPVYDLSPKIQSPFYQTYERNEYDLLVKNTNVFASPNAENTFNFMQASANKERQYSYNNYYDAINRQMAQYADFTPEIDNSKSSPFIDYHDQPIYSDSFRVKNSSYQRADRLIGTPRRRPLLYSPSLSARRGLFWY